MTVKGITLILKWVIKLWMRIGVILIVARTVSITGSLGLPIGGFLVVSVGMQVSGVQNPQAQTR